MKLTTYLLPCILLVYSTTHAVIRVVCTAALIPEQYETRQEEYIKSLLIIKNMGFTPYVVESCMPKDSHTFLDDYAQVYYSHTNNKHLRNKGVNECVSLLAAFEQWGFDDEDIIIKTTGRYYFNSDRLIKLITQHPEYDMFIRWGKGGKEFVTVGHVFTGCYVMRYKYFKDMLKRINFNSMEQNLVPIEGIVADYANQCMESRQVYDVRKLDMTARVGYGDSLSRW